MICIVQYYGRQLTDDELRDSINDRNGRPYTFLQYVVCDQIARDVAISQALLAKCLAYGAHINIQDKWGCTALHYAADRSPATLTTLCLAGAKLHIRDRYGATPLDKTIWGGCLLPESARLLATYAARDARCTAAIVALLNRRFREAKQLPRDVARIIGRMLWAPKSRRSEVWGE